MCMFGFWMKGWQSIIWWHDGLLSLKNVFSLHIIIYSRITYFKYNRIILPAYYAKANYHVFLMSIVLSKIICLMNYLWWAALENCTTVYIMSSPPGYFTVDVKWTHHHRVILHFSKLSHMVTCLLSLVSDNSWALSHKSCCSCKVDVPLQALSNFRLALSFIIKTRSRGPMLL